MPTKPSSISLKEEPIEKEIAKSGNTPLSLARALQLQQTKAAQITDLPDRRENEELSYGETPKEIMPTAHNPMGNQISIYRC